MLAGGAVVAITSVVLTILYGQTRIMFAMCRDGLMPPALAEVNPRTGTPIALTLAFGILISVLAALVPLTEIIKLVNIGTLFAFMLVNVGVIILRRTNPDMERTFRVPFSPVFPIIGVALCIYLMTKLPGETWIRFVFWLVVGFVDLLLLRPQALQARQARGGRARRRRSAPPRPDPAGYGLESADEQTA